MTAQIIVLSDYKKSKGITPKELGYAEWVRFCLDPFGLLEAFARRNRTEGDER